MYYSVGVRVLVDGDDIDGIIVWTRTYEEKSLAINEAFSTAFKKAVDKEIEIRSLEYPNKKISYVGEAVTRGFGIYTIADMYESEDGERFEPTDIVW